MLIRQGHLIGRKCHISARFKKYKYITAQQLCYSQQFQCTLATPPGYMKVFIRICCRGHALQICYNGVVTFILLMN